MQALEPAVPPAPSSGLLAPKTTQTAGVWEQHQAARKGTGKCIVRRKTSLSSTPWFSQFSLQKDFPGVVTDTWGTVQQRAGGICLLNKPVMMVDIIRDKERPHWEHTGKQFSSTSANQETQELKPFCSSFAGNQISSAVVSLWKWSRNNPNPHRTNLNFSTSLQDLLKRFLVFLKKKPPVEPSLETAFTDRAV